MLKLSFFAIALSLAVCSYAQQLSAEQYLVRMNHEIDRIFDSKNIQIKNSSVKTTDLTTILSGTCGFFNTTEVEYAAIFDEGSRIRSFSVGVPIGQKFDNSKIQTLIKNGDYMNLFLPQDVKRGLFMNRYTVNFNESLAITNVIVDFSLNTSIPFKIFGLPNIKIKDLKVGYRVDNPLISPSLSGKCGGTLFWGDVGFPFETLLSRNPKDFAVSVGIKNLTLNSVVTNFGIPNDLLIPPSINNVLRIDSAKLTVFPAAYTFIFEGGSPLGAVNFVVKRVTVDNKPVIADTMAFNTSLTGGYSANPENPDPPPGEPNPVITPVSVNKWGILAGFQLPESNEQVPAVKFMRKAGLTNIGLVVSTIQDAGVETSLPIFSNIGSGNTLIQKGFTFLAWISVNDLITKYYLTKPLRYFAPELTKSVATGMPIESIMFRANVPVTLTDFSLEGDINFNKEMKLIPPTKILVLKQLKLMMKPLATSPEFSFGATWEMAIDPVRAEPLVFNSNMFVKTDGSSVTLGVDGTMMSSWKDPYGYKGLAINSPKFKGGLSFSDAIIPIPDDLFFSGQMMYGNVMGDITLGVNYNELMKNMFVGRVCNLSLKNVLDQWLGGMVSTEFNAKKNIYKQLLEEALNIQLKDAYLKVVPPMAPAELMSGLRLEEDYTASCPHILKLENTFLPGVRIAAAGEFVGWKGMFDIGAEGNLSSLTGGVTVKGSMDPIKLTAPGGFKIFHLTGYNDNEPFQLYFDLSTNSFINGIKANLSDASYVAETAGDKIFYLTGSVTILDIAKGKTLIDLTPSGYKLKASGKIYKVLDAKIDATIGSFRNILGTTSVNGTVETGVIQQKIVSAVSKRIGDIPFFDELKKGFVLNSIQFGGNLEGLQSKIDFLVDFKIAGSSYKPSITLTTTEIASGLDAIAEKIADLIKTTASPAIEFARKTFNDAINFAKESAAKSIAFATQTSQNATNATKAAAAEMSGLQNTLRSTAATTFNSTKTGISSVGTKAEKFFKDLSGFSSATAEKIYNRSIAQIKNGWEGFSEAIKKAFTGGDNEERITTNGPAFRVLTKYQGQYLTSVASVKKNLPVQVKPRSNTLMETWQIVPNDKPGTFFFVSGYNALLVAKPWNTYLPLIPHESEHKGRERMVMEIVPNEPGWFYLRYDATDNTRDGVEYVFAEVKNIVVENVAQTGLAPVKYIGTNKPGENGKFKFEKAGDIDWSVNKNFPPVMTPAAPLVSGNRYQFNGEPEQYIYENGTFRWIPDVEALSLFKFESKPFTMLPNNQQVSVVLGPSYASGKDGSLFKFGNQSEVFIMDRGKARWIPDIETFNMMELNAAMVQVLPISDLNIIQKGDPIPSKFNAGVSLQERMIYKVIGNPLMYVLINKTFRIIPDMETLGFLGFNSGQFQEVNLETFKKLTAGTPIASRKNGQLIMLNTGDPAVYIMENGIRRAFPDAETFNAMKLDWNRILKLNAEDLNDIPKGPALISMK